MTGTDLRTASPDTPGIAPVSKFATARVALSLIRNPLKALPPEIFSEPAVFTRLGGVMRVHLADPALIHEALVKNAHLLGKGEDVRRALGPALGQGLLTADGDHWKWQRQSVAAAFRHEKLLELLPVMIDAARRTQQRWHASPAGDIDIGHEMMRTTFDIIVETMMSGGHGIDIARVEQSITDYLKPTGWTFALAMLGAPEWLPHPGRRKARAAVDYLRSSLATVISERRQNPIERNDLVSMLLEAKDPETGRMMSDTEIIDNLLTFITAGHETTALGLAWTFHLLSQNSDVERKVIDEIEAVTAGEPVAADHIARLTYTRQVFSEAMRLYPPAPVVTRTALQDFRLGEHDIPAGTVLYVPIYAVHRHTTLWEEPDRFDPSRFQPEKVKARHRYAYMPFGAGPRVCIGNAFAMMEAVAILAVLLQNDHLRNKSPGNTEPLMRVTLRPENRLMMQVSSRKNKSPAA
ncbi:cytochrome P450 [Agrobacterium tumefaciens]|uniref:cytochrome P450 n=1 Tax=Agrobacterium TaxID=357 RepID=UPI00115DA81D|nr:MULTISPECIES: cytochrome P450 [Agrobacterium]MDA5241964.1 cytochrome P450 [Agrobacterium sp. MAFF310724]MDA5249126.1 cytochrome P450 [Agrobacterium sp. MAFF210268]NTE81384.1 cytochrome P450 [Agrobacterium tumefaciens]TRB15311.1 cytochrome P450 [Agrobacterium tumefaciens]WCA60048.1 cytochrome P450 [Agrobacterium tumefaciens]